MRNVIAAFILLIAITGVSAWSSIHLCGELDTLGAMVAEIPADADSMKKDADGVRTSAERLMEKWDAMFPYLAYVTGYTALNRADDAVLEFCSAAENGSYPDAAVARLKLLDALTRMRELESVTPGSIF
ncbi:MAG: hypothetical protein IJ449_00415 [Clostridia bacterium]|nr:hypothetical protein [Clostridia bacterium]